MNEEDVDAKSENNLKEGEDVVTVDVELSANKTVENVELTVYLECRDHWLSKDQSYYTEQLNKFSEIERVDDMWINSKPNYNVGTYLETNLAILQEIVKNFSSF